MSQYVRLSPLAGILFAAAALPACSCHLYAQATDQPSAIAGFRDSLGAIADIAGLKNLRSRVTASDPIGRFRLGVIDHRLGELTGRREPLDQAIRQFAEVAGRQPGWAEAWYGMALAKLELYAQGFPVKEGPYQRLGTDYLHGAAAAFIEALKADPGFAAAAERLAATVLRQTFQPQLTEALVLLRRAAAGPARTVPAIQMSQGLVEQETGNADSALAAFDRYLRLGGDSALGLLEEARTLFHSGRPVEAQTAYYAGASLATSTAALAHYRSDIAWVARPEELAQFDSTGAGTREHWLREFWQRRDLEDGRRPGERLVEHYRRLFHVMRYFRLPLRQQGLAAGNDIRSPLLRDRAITAEDRLRQLVRNLAAADRSVAGGLPIVEAADQVVPGAPGSAAPANQLSEIYARLNDQTLLRAYRSAQSMVDDRGVIYMRHGEPGRRATYAGSDADPNESWWYLTASGPWIFHFTGIAAPTTLIEQLPLNPALLESRGGLDPRYHRMADDAGRYRLQPTLIEQDRSLARRAIAVGTTTDSYALRFDRPLGPVVQVFGVRDGLDGDGRLLIVFAVKGQNLSSARLGPDSLIGYPIALRIVARNAATGAVSLLDTTRAFVTRRVLGKDEFLTGQSQMAVAPGVYRVQVILADGRGESGSAVWRDTLLVPDFGAPGLAMSHAVLGRRGSGQQWIAEPDTVPLNPLNAYPTGGLVDVYYQVGGMQPRHTYETRIEVRKRGARSGGVSTSFRERSRAPRAARARSIALTKLAPGEYVLTVTLTEVNGPGIVSRSQLLNVTKE